MPLRTLLPVLTEKELALGLLQKAVAQLLPQGLVSIPTEKLLNQLQDVQEPSQQPTYRWASPCTCPSVPRTALSWSAPALPGEASGVQGREPGTGRCRLTACPGGRGQPPPRDPPGSVCCSEAHSAKPDSAASRGVPEGVTCVSCSQTGLEEPQLALQGLFGKTR